MKITPEDIRTVRRLAVSPADNEEWTIQLALILVGIYDRGYADGWEDGRQEVDPA